MTVRKIYTCNVCGAERKEANHWFIGQLTLLGIHIHKWEWAVAQNILDGQDVVHLCGQECVNRVMNQFMGSPSLTIWPTSERTEDDETHPAGAAPCL